MERVNPLSFRSLTEKYPEFDLLPGAVMVLDPDRQGFGQEHHLVDGGVEFLGVIDREDPSSRT